MEIQEYFKQFQKETVLKAKEANELLKVLSFAPQTEDKHFLFDEASEEAKEAYDILIRKNMRLVLHCCLRFCKIDDARIMDLVSAGTLGLIRALEKFDIDTGFKFSTYGVYWIQAMIRRELSMLETKTHLYKSLHTKFKAARKELIEKIDRIPTEAEIIKYLRWDEETYFKFQCDQERLMIPIDALTSDQNDIYDPAVVEESTIEQLLEDMRTNEERTLLNQALQKLSPLESIVVKLHFGIGEPRLTYDQITERLGLPRDRVRTLENKACRKLWLFLQGESYHK